MRRREFIAATIFAALPVRAEQPKRGLNRTADFAAESEHLGVKLSKKPRRSPSWRQIEALAEVANFR